MLCRAQFKVFRQFETNADGTIVSNGHHGCGVQELGEISSEAEFGFEEQEEMASGSAAQGLKLNVSAEEIARVGRTRGSRPAGAGWLGERATAEVGFVV